MSTNAIFWAWPGLLTIRRWCGFVPTNIVQLAERLVWFVFRNLPKTRCYKPSWIIGGKWIPFRRPFFREAQRFSFKILNHKLNFRQDFHKNRTDAHKRFRTRISTRWYRPALTTDGEISGQASMVFPIQPDLKAHAWRNATHLHGHVNWCDQKSTCLPQNPLRAIFLRW